MSAGRPIPALLALVLAACATSGTPEGRYLRDFATAEQAGRPFSPVTEAVPALTIEGAYRLQKRIATQRLRKGDRIVGFKGGLMSEASLRARNVTEPLVGVLFASGRVETGGVIPLCGYRRASFEVKLGYRFARTVTDALDTPALKRAVAAVVPVIDLPDIGYRDPDHYSAVDMVAANVSAARWVVGNPMVSPETVDLDALPVSIARAGQSLAAGLGRESLGNQWGSLAMVVRRIVASGRSVKPGDIVITGKIGDRGWLPPGRYRASYGAANSVDFTVVPCTR